MKTYSIKEISRMFHFPSSTLRYYEDMGLLTDVERTASGQRIYTDKHVNRLKTICCFKNTGMTIAQLKEFFSYEIREDDCIDDILLLLEEQKESVSAQITQMQKDYIHVCKKIRYYKDIKKSLETQAPHPDWKDYK
ncbi:MAG: MerR family transcriptional regulator [Eubacteriales bacterium]|nr:MerR family transcriptional regulator [Eubacteriales bacterium]